MRHPKKHIEPPCKTKIRLAAIKLFADRGIDNVAVKDIMRTARTTQPMLYYYFGCKDKLCERIYGDLMSEAVNGAGDIMASKAGLEAKLAELFNFHSTFFASHPGATRFILQGFLSPHYGRIFKDVRERMMAVHALNLERMVKYHISTGEVSDDNSRELFSLIDGLTLHFMINHSNTPEERSKRSTPSRLGAFIRKGLGTAGSLLLAIGLIAPAAAQDASTAPWTLEHCLAKAMEVNPGMQAARQGVKAAQGQNLMAISEFMPQVKWNSIYADNSYTPSPGAARASYGSDDFYLSTLSADLNVFSWRMVPLRRTMKANTRLAALKLAAARNDLTLNVKKAFFTSLYAKQLQTIAQAAEAVAKENLETSQALYKEGKVSTFDVSRASVRYVNSKTAVISARNTLTVALENLRLLLSLKPGESMEIAGELPEEPLEASLTEQLDRAMSGRPELQQARTAEDLQISARELARAGFLPTVFAGFSYSWEGREFAPGSSSGDYKYWTAKAGISIPIFDGMFSVGRYKAQKAGVEQARQQTQATADGVVAEVRQHYYSLANSKESLGAQKENVETAAENLRIAQERYRMGLLSLLDLKDAELSDIEARTQQIKTLYDYNVARTSLERAVGLPASGE